MKPHRRVIAAVSAMAAAVVVVGCATNLGLADPDGALPKQPSTPTTVWELIDRLAVDPADTIAEARAVAGGPVEPFGYGGRFESELTDISDQLRQVQLFTGYTARGAWTFTAVTFSLDRCVPIREVVTRYPTLMPAGATHPGPNAKRYLAQNMSWGRFTMAFGVDDTCLVGVSMRPFGR